MWSERVRATGKTAKLETAKLNRIIAYSFVGGFSDLAERCTESSTADFEQQEQDKER